MERQPRIVECSNEEVQTGRVRQNNVENSRRHSQAQRQLGHEQVRMVVASEEPNDVDEIGEVHNMRYEGHAERRQRREDHFSLGGSKGMVVPMGEATTTTTADDASMGVVATMNVSQHDQEGPKESTKYNSNAMVRSSSVSILSEDNNSLRCLEEEKFDDDDDVKMGAVGRTLPTTNRNNKSSVDNPSLCEMGDVVEILSKNPDIRSVVERGVASILSSQANPSNSGGIDVSLTDDITRRVVQNILSSGSNNNSQNNRATSAPKPAKVSSSTRTSRLRNSSRSRSHSPNVTSSYYGTNVSQGQAYVQQQGNPQTQQSQSFQQQQPSSSSQQYHSNHHHHPPPVKTVSFSSISTPHFLDEEANHQRIGVTGRMSPWLGSGGGGGGLGSDSAERHGGRAHSRSPPPSSPPTSPMRRTRRHRSRSPYSGSIGESTASGDGLDTMGDNSSVSSVAASTRVVYFSAMNPNPSSSSRGGAVVSFEDEQRRRGGGSSGGGWSRSSICSGLSSPPIEPALSPPLERSGSPRSGDQRHLRFHTTIETITEAAERLRRETQAPPNRGGPGGDRRVVHFSAMIRRDVPPASDRPTTDDQLSGSVARVHFQEGGDGEARLEEAVVTNDDDDDRASLPMLGVARDAATRLRALIHRAETRGHSLESCFRLLYPRVTLEGDGDNCGDNDDTNTVGTHLSAADVRRGLRRIVAVANESDGNSNLEERAEPFIEDNDDEICEELLELFDTNQDGYVSLLEFYRFMGRKSPPLPDTSNESKGPNY